MPIEQQKSYEQISLINNATGNSVNESKYSFAKTTCYPTALWDISGPMVEAVYDDYGRFKLVNNKENILNLQNLFKHLCSKSLIAPNSGDEGGFDINKVFDRKKEYTFAQLKDIWNYMFTSCEQNKVFVNDYKGISSPFSFAVIHKATGKYLIDMVENSERWNNEPLSQKNH